MAVARRACLLALTALAGLWPVRPAAASPAGDVVSHARDVVSHARDVVFQAQTTATAVHVTMTQQPAGSLITASLFDDAVGYAAGNLDGNGSSEALASPVFPGRLVIQGPALLCSQVFTCPTDPPDYPLVADASYPRQPRDRAAAAGTPMGEGPFVVSPLDAAAVAGPDANTGRTSGGAISLLAGTPGAVTVGASRAVSHIRAVGRDLRVRVEAHVSDVRVGALVSIGSVHATDHITIRPGQRPVDHPNVTVSRVTVAGHPATIDDDGVHVDGADGPSVRRQLDRSGVAIRTVGVQRADTRRVGRSDATGLAVDVVLPVSGVPYIPNPLPPLPPPFDQIPPLPGINANGRYLAHITLGSVGAVAGIGVEPTFDLGDATGTPAAPAARGGGQRAATGTPPPGGTDLVDGLSAPAPESPPAVAPPQSLLGRFEDVLSKAQLEALYAVLALGSVGLFVGWRATVLLRRRALLPSTGGRLRDRGIR